MTTTIDRDREWKRRIRQEENQIANVRLLGFVVACVIIFGVFALISTY